MQESIARQAVRAQDPSERPAPAGGPGTLSITDERTGKTYKARATFFTAFMRSLGTLCPALHAAHGQASHGAADACWCQYAHVARTKCQRTGGDDIHLPGMQVNIGEGGTIQGSDLNKIKAGGDGVGLRMYDPGYVNTTAVISRICFIDGAKGILRYRGYPIEQV